MNKTYKNLKKYMNKLLNDSNPYIFNKTTLNIYSITYYSFIIIGLERLIESFISKNPAIEIVTSCGLFISSYIIKKEGLKKIPYVLLLTMIFDYVIYYLANNLMLIPIFLVIISYPIILLIKLLKIKSLSHFYLYEENGFRGCNLLLKEVTPIIDYENLIKIKIKAEKNLNSKELKQFNDNLLLFCDKHKYLFMGFVYDKNLLNYEGYIYACEYNIELIKKYLNNNVNYKYTIEETNDKDFIFYYKNIIPSDKLFLHMCNRNIIDNKLPKEINLNDEQNLILILSFNTKNNALNCMEELKKTDEYHNIKYEDNTKYVNENNIDETFNHILYIEKKTRIGLSKINLITDSMYDYAVKFNGSFQEWGIGIIDD